MRKLVYFESINHNPHNIQHFHICLLLQLSSPQGLNTDTGTFKAVCMHVYTHKRKSDVCDLTAAIKNQHHFFKGGFIAQEGQKVVKKVSRDAISLVECRRITTINTEIIFNAKIDPSTQTSEFYLPKQSTQ